MSLDVSLEDQAKLDQLRRIKWLATGVLILCLATFLFARSLPELYPQWAFALGFVAAFSEAAMIGGLADWYAVVVLFRHPLGLKIPHTAIIPANQTRIADNMGEFLERNFLSENVVREKLHEIDFAAHVTAWLSDPEKSTRLSNFAVKMIPDILDAIEDSGFKDFAAGRIAEQVQKTEIAPVAAKLIDSFVKDGRYQLLLDEIIDALDKVIHDEDTLKSIQKRVAEELPTVLYVLQADSVILKRIVKASGAMLADVKENPEHPLRQEFQDLFESYVERMKSSRRFARRVERFKKEMVERPEIASLADKIWDNLADYVSRDAARKNSILAKELSQMLVGLAQQLKKDERLCREINTGMVTTLSSVIDDKKSEVSLFVSDQVKSWDFRQLVTLIEANVGRDLQYIRFNGMLIGGCAGLVLHILDISIFH